MWVDVYGVVGIDEWTDERMAKWLDGLMINKWKISWISFG